jgi:sugar transferase (PEP-CTERM/EpsH1 system associated)
MRVLVLTHRLPYAPNRGDRIRAYYLLKTLAGLAQIDLVSLVHDANEAGHAAALASQVDSLIVAPVPRGKNLMRCVPALASSTPLTHVLLSAPTMKPALRHLVATRRPDVVFAYGSGMAQYLFEPELRDVPAIVDMVDVDSAKWAELARSSAAPRSWIFLRESRTLSRFEAMAARHALATLTVNEREHRALETFAPGTRILTVPNGIDYGYFRPHTPPAADPTVVFCGVMNYAPNERGAIWMGEHVWPHVRAAEPRARLMLVGSNPTTAVRRLHDPSIGIIVTGYVPDVRPYLWNAAVAAAPIWIARGLQNKVLEALAAGLPCVVTPPVAEGLPPEALPGIRIAADASAFSSDVIDLLKTSADERRAMAALASIASLDWSSQLAPIVDLLHNAVRHGAAPRISCSSG